MAITIEMKDGGYVAYLSTGDRSWTSGQPVTAEDLIDELLLRGCKPNEITDALTLANPNWQRLGE